MDYRSKGDIMPDVLFDPSEIPADLLEFFEIADFDAKTNVLRINTQSSGEEHYAAYPRALVQPMVMAGTSERGCCSECGAPHKRIVRKSGGTTGKLPQGNRPGALETGSSSMPSWNSGDGS